MPATISRLVRMAVALALFSQGAIGWARDDWHLWHEEEVTAWTRGRYQLGLYQTSRYRHDLSEAYYVQGKLINRFVIHPRLIVAANYSYIQEKGAGNHWREEHRPEWEVIPSVVVGPFTVEQRLRMELRALEGTAGEEEWRYRHRFQVSAAVPGLDGRLKLFVNEEPFYSAPPDEWNQNRLFVGAQAALAKAAAVTVAWGIQSVRRGGDWDERQVLFISAKVAF